MNIIEAVQIQSYISMAHAFADVLYGETKTKEERDKIVEKAFLEHFGDLPIYREALRMYAMLGMYGQAPCNDLLKKYEKENCNAIVNDTDGGD